MNITYIQSYVTQQRQFKEASSQQYGPMFKKKIKRANSHIINLAPCLNALEESEEIKRKIKYCVTYIYLNLFCQWHWSKKVKLGKQTHGDIFTLTEDLSKYLSQQFL